MFALLSFLSNAFVAIESIHVHLSAVVIPFFIANAHLLQTIFPLEDPWE